MTPRSVVKRGSRGKRKWLILPFETYLLTTVCNAFSNFKMVILNSYRNLHHNRFVMYPAAILR